MLGRNKSTPNETAIEEVESRLLAEMLEYGPNEPRYEDLLEKLERLKKLTPQKEKIQINPNTVISAGCGILSVVIIVAYEHAHVITTKAMPFIPKTS